MVHLLYLSFTSRRRMPPGAVGVGSGWAVPLCNSASTSSRLTRVLLPARTTGRTPSRIIRRTKYSVTPVSGSIALSSATIPAAVRIRGMVSDMVRALLLGGRQGLGPDDGPAVIAVDTGGQQVAVTVGDLCLQVHRVQGAAPRAEGVDAVGVDGQQLLFVQQVKHGQASFLHPSSS